MKMTHAIVFVLLIGSCIFANAQTRTPTQVPPDDVRHMAGGLVFHTNSVVISADEGDLNLTTGVTVLSSPVKVRPTFRQGTTAVAATNLAGAPFPEIPPMVMHFSGKFQIAIDNMTIHADEADVNVRTDEVELRGNVTVMNPPVPPR
jgi:hypothetical protein